MKSWARVCQILMKSSAFSAGLRAHSRISSRTRSYKSTIPDVTLSCTTDNLITGLGSQKHLQNVFVDCGISWSSHRLQLSSRNMRVGSMEYQSDSYMFDIVSTSVQMERQLVLPGNFHLPGSMNPKLIRFIVLQCNYAHFAAMEVITGRFRPYMVKHRIKSVYWIFRSLRALINAFF